MAGLAERRVAGGGPIAVVSCDNLPGNGPATARVVMDFAELAEPALVPWIRDNVSFVSTMVDRMTMRGTAGDIRAARELTEAARQVPLPAADLAGYRAALLTRFGNPRIRHTLAQVAADGSRKIPLWVLPVLRAERADGRAAPGAVRILAAWIDHLRGAGVPVDDPGAGPCRSRAGDVRALLGLLAPDLAGDESLINELEKAL